MKNKRPYHSAVAANDAKITAPEMSGVFPIQGGVVMDWDITNGDTRDEFRDCDLIYSEPAWADGLPDFMERAGGDKGLTFSAYMAALTAIIREIGKPTAMLCGKKGASLMPPTRRRYPVTINGGKAEVLFYNGAYAEGATNDDLIKDLAQQYYNVGDFCCGYGNTGRIFNHYGKEFVMSDINPKCVGYIHENSRHW